MSFIPNFPFKTKRFKKKRYHLFMMMMTMMTITM